MIHTKDLEPGKVYKCMDGSLFLVLKCELVGVGGVYFVSYLWLIGGVRVGEVVVSNKWFECATWYVSEFATTEKQ